MPQTKNKFEEKPEHFSIINRLDSDECLIMTSHANPT